MATIVCVTSCITGIAHTYMAAEALEQAGKKLGHNVMVETQGSAGSNPFKQDVIWLGNQLSYRDCDDLGRCRPTALSRTLGKLPPLPSRRGRCQPTSHS